MAVSLASLITVETAQTLLTKALIVAESLGLPVTSWSPGDPSRVFLITEAEALAALEEQDTQFIRAGFLDTAEGDWLKLRVEQSYSITPIEASFATTEVTLFNGSGGEFVIEPGDLTFENTETQKTYHNTASGTLAIGPGTTLTLDVEADEAGSDSNAAIGEIASMITQLDELVTCTNTAAALATDAEDEISMRQRARDKLGALSPDGPPDAYRYVATTPELAGTSAVTRVRTQPDNGTGVVLVSLAGPSGEVAAADVALVAAAILRWATPLCVRPEVFSATAVVVPITYQIWVYARVSKTEEEITDAIDDALVQLFQERPIGGDVILGVGKLYQSLIASAIRGVFGDDTFRVIVSAPAADVTLGLHEVPVLGAVSGVVNFVANPT